MPTWRCCSEEMHCTIRGTANSRETLSRLGSAYNVFKWCYHYSDHRDRQCDNHNGYVPLCPSTEKLHYLNTDFSTNIVNVITVTVALTDTDINLNNCSLSVLRTCCITILPVLCDEKCFYNHYLLSSTNAISSCANCSRFT